jgi:hypothetical protein
VQRRFVDDLKLLLQKMKGTLLQKTVFWNFLKKCSVESEVFGFEKIEKILDEKDLTAPSLSS